MQESKYSEFIFQFIILAIAAIIFTFNREDEVFDFKRLPSFAVFVTASLFIGYYLLPQFFYKKKYKLFFAISLALVFLIIGIEELVVEKIMYPDTRGLHFHGILFSLAEIIPILLLLVSFKFAWDLNKKQRAIEALQNTAQESELRFLKSQINPHFLFNNLNNLYSYSITDPNKTSDIILELSSVLRYMLYDCRADWVPLQKEMTHLANFVSLNELQIEDRGDIRLEIDNQSSGFEIAPLILMVFVENAFKHSTASMSSGIKVDIQVKVSASGNLHFTSSNSFEEVSNNDNLSSGIGLKNVIKRLNIIYPKAHNLQISSDDGTYLVDLQIQLKKAQA